MLGFQGGNVQTRGLGLGLHYESVGSKSKNASAAKESSARPSAGHKRGEQGFAYQVSEFRASELVLPLFV